MLADEPLPSPWLDHATRNAIAGYVQCEEKEAREFEDGWRALEIPKGFVRVLGFDDH